MRLRARVRVRSQPIHGALGSRSSTRWSRSGTPLVRAKGKGRGRGRARGRARSRAKGRVKVRGSPNPYPNPNAKPNLALAPRARSIIVPG